MSSLSSLPSLPTSSLTTSSLSLVVSPLTSHTLIFGLPKIKRLDPASLPSIPSFSRNDLLRIFHGKKILFIGDPSIRTLFRDFLKMSVNGQILSDGETRALRPNCKLFPGEIKLELGELSGKSCHFDIRSFKVVAEDISIFYVHLSTIIGPEIDSPKSWISQNGAFDLIIFSSAFADMNFIKINQSNQSFDIQLNEYEIKLKSICQYLHTMSAMRTLERAPLIWIPPLPPREMSDLQKGQFKQIIDVCDLAAKTYSFHQFSCLEPWPYKSQAFFPKGGCQLSAKGARCLTTLISLMVAKHWKEPQSNSSGSISTITKHTTTIDIDNQCMKKNDDKYLNKCTKSKSSNRSHPYC